MKPPRYLLVGGAGGLGMATTLLLAEAGAELIVSYRSDQERAEKFKDVALVLSADITNRQHRKALLDVAVDIDGLVVFAGVPARVENSEQLETQMAASYAANYQGPLLMASEAAARMKSNGIAGSIVLFATMQAVTPFTGSSAYAGAKAALTQGAKILAKETRAANIRVNVIAPGVMEAGMAQVSIASGKYSHYLESGAIACYGRADDVAHAVQFLLRPDSYITGQVLVVDGGLTL